MRNLGLTMRNTLRRAPAVFVAAAFVAAATLTTAACDSGSAAGTTGTSAATQTTVAIAGATSSTVASTPASTAAPTTAPSTGSTSGATSAAQTGTVLFDDSKLHQISVTFAQAGYDEMIAAYKSSGAKEWIAATVTIDGTTYQNVGMRLKGNSSLRSLATGRDNGPGGNVSATDPQGLPWLIRLDKNVDGQNHEGVTDIVVRSNNSATSLNEAVALELLAEAGLASQRAIAVEFTVNGGAAKLRLVTELPEDMWMAEHFSSTGALYKAESTGDYSYRGTDPESYTDVFDQEAGKDNTDLTPLIEFLDFINNADDATFNSTLADKVDIDSLATYLAMEELLNNFDDIDGPGNNSYLYWDAATGRFTVVAWDHNLAFGAMGGNRPGGGGPQGGPFPAEKAPGGVAPGGAAPGPNAPDGNNQNMGPRGKTNLLVQRFHANSEFEALYQEKLNALKKEIFTSGFAPAILAEWVDVLKTQAADLVDATIVDTEAAKISAYLQAK